MANQDLTLGQATTNLGNAFGDWAGALGRTISDILKAPDPNDLHIKKFIEGLPTRGWVQDGYAYLIVYNSQCPSKTYILKERF